jgi:hypothetical protein
VNGDGISINKCGGRSVRGLEVLHDDLSQFQVAKVDRAVPACPLVIWISHFAFFDLCHESGGSTTRTPLGLCKPTVQCET